MDKKLAFFGKNLANIVYLHSKALRDLGKKVDIYIGYEDVTEKAPKKSWIFREKRRMNWIEKIMLALRVARKYKYIQCYSGTSAVINLIHNNFTVYASSHALTLQYLNKHKIYKELARKSLNNAKAILYADYAHKHVFEEFRVEEKSFSIRQPFYLEEWREELKKNKIKKEFFLMPSRLDIEDKNNEVVFEGYKKYRSEGGKIRLKALSWGPDKEYFKRKYKEVGVEFQTPVPRKELKILYLKSYLVFDRFNEDKIIGLIPIEAWASGTNVVSWVELEWYEKQYGEKVPIYNTKDPAEIAELMWKAEENYEKYFYNEKELINFVKKHHDPKKIGKKMIKIYEEIGWEI